MPYVKDIKFLLDKILRTYAEERSIVIRQLQDKIWDEPGVQDEELMSMLTDLASDLNFYEPEERDRNESLGYYDDEKLNTLVNKAIEKIDIYISK
jgi:hypothetical protein